jgi:transcriptional regulator with XRE-family HTH domain
VKNDDPTSILIARNLRLLREERGLKQEEVAAEMNKRLKIDEASNGDEGDDKKPRQWYQSTVYKVEQIPPSRRISFTEGVMLAEIYGATAEALLRPLGDDDEGWQEIRNAAREVDEAVDNLGEVLGWVLSRARTLDRVVKAMPPTSMPLDSAKVLGVLDPSILSAMQELQNAIQKRS